MPALIALALTGITVAAALLHRDPHTRRLTWRRRCRTRRGRRWPRMVAWGAVAVVLLGPALLAPHAQAADVCHSQVPPPVEHPGDGLVGKSDSGSAVPGLQGSPGTAYGDYGYAGQTWSTYDLGCMPSEDQVMDGPGTFLANLLFDIAKGWVGIANALNYTLADPHAFAWLTSLIKLLTPLLWNGIFTVWAGLMLLVLGVVVLRHALSGDNAGSAKRAGWGLIGLWVAAATAAMPVAYHDVFRGVLVGLSGQAQAGFVDTSDHRQVNAVPDILSQQVIYPAWLEGEFGHATTDQARQLGPQLLHAQACTKAELATHHCNDQAKQAQFSHIAQKMGPTYPVFQGKQPLTRLSAATTAAFQAGWIALFQIVAKTTLALALIVIAFMIILGPVTGLMGMLNAEALRNLARTMGTALLNGIIAALLGGLHVRLVLIVTHSDMDFFSQGLVMVLSTWILLLILRPLKRLRGMLSAALNVTGQSLPSSATRFVPMPRRRGPRPHGSGGTADRDGDTGGDTGGDTATVRGGHRTRWQHASRGTTPEAHSTGRSASGSGLARRGATLAASAATGGAAGAATAAATGGTRATPGGGAGRAATHAATRRATSQSGTGARGADSGTHRATPGHAPTGRLRRGTATRRDREPATTSTTPHAEPHPDQTQTRHQPQTTRSAPSTADHARPADSGHAAPTHRPRPSSVGLLDDSDDVYRASEHDEPARRDTVLDAERDDRGAWRVRHHPDHPDDEHPTSGEEPSP